RGGCARGADDVQRAARQPVSAGGSRESGGLSDYEGDQFIGNLLRAGVIIAATVAVVGGVLYLAQHALVPADFREFRGEPSDLRSVRGIFDGAAALRSLSVIQLGLVLLIATPVARVAFALVAFALQRDRVYVVVTTIVLALLLFSL